MKLWLRIHGYEPCSWTFVWQNLKEAFERFGYDVMTYEQPEHPEEYVEMWWGDPQYFRWSRFNVRAKAAIALTEARSIRYSGRNKVIHNLNEADIIFCPSDFAAIGLLEAPIETPIRIAHFGVDIDEFPCIERDWDGDLSFLHAGVPQFRKGSWLVPEAFISAFDEEDDVSLTIHTFFKQSEMFKQLKAEYGKHPKINFVDNMEASAVDIYNDHHVYVSPHLSEGFGLMVAEAMSTGMPCLVSRCSAPREFFDSRYGYWIEMSEDYVPVDQCMPDTDGFWRVPDLDSLASGMRKLYDNREEAELRGIEGSKSIASSLTWDHAVRKIDKYLNEVLDTKGYGASGIRKLYNKETRIENSISNNASV